MDHSSHPPLAVLQELKNSFSDCDKITSILPTLVECFEKEEDTQVLQEIISSMLGPVVQALPLQDVDHTVLQPFLPLLTHYISKILSAIHIVLQSNIPEDSVVPDITKYLEICVQILTDMNHLLSYIISLNHVTIPDIFNVPRNVADLIYQVFVHCQKSKAEYKETFLAVRSELMCLFQECHKVQLNLFTLLNEKLHFNCTYENELRLLIDVLDILSSMAEVVADLDTMSLVAHWKGYAQLTQTYAIHLCSRLDITCPINYLAVNINHQLSNFSTHVSSEKKVAVRSVKITSLQLKVLIKLCDQYKGYLGDCHKELLNCLITLSAHTSQYLSEQEVDADIAAQMTTHLSAGAAPLLTHLLNDPLFVQNYLQYADKFLSIPLIARVGYCQLTNLVLKKLIQLCSKDDEIQSLWLKPTLPIVKTVFKLLCWGSTSEGVSLVYDDDIYQPLLVNTAAFLVVTCTYDMFSQLETLVMENLLQPLLWPALFSSDLLCLIARFGSNELCLQLTHLLSDMLSCWPAWDWHRPEWVYVSWTQGRLIQLLSSDHIKGFPSRLPSFSTLASDITILLNVPFDDKSVVLFQSLIERFTLFGDNMVLLPSTDHTLKEALYQLWQYMTVPPEAECTESSHWFIGFYSILVIATSSLSNSLNNHQIGHILNVLIKASGLNTTLFHCSACEFLRSLATKTLANDSSQSLVCHKMSSLFIQLIQDKNPVVKEVAFETFSFFAHVTKYEPIVAYTVANDCQLQAEITSYLERVPTVHSNTLFHTHLQWLHHNFYHKCNISNKFNKQELEFSDPHPCKKLKTSLEEESVAAALLRIEKDITLIEEYRSHTVMSQSHMLNIQNILTRLDKIMKTP